MRIAVIGGKLQGLEILYLAGKAGFETLLIDKNRNLPAGKLCDKFIEFHFFNPGIYPADIGKIDLIFPALEDLASLEIIVKWGQQINVPVVFDLDAFRISSSKRLSNILIEKLELPRPKKWPDCSLPVIVKPDDSSGSEGVGLIHEQEKIEELLNGAQERLIIEEYVEGPSYSIEIIGKPGNYVPLVITELFMDRDYDCCGVLAPAPLAAEYRYELNRQVLKIAEALDLYGIMDLEVILHDGELKILEIDARFPSQTPLAVFHATGVNMVTVLAELFTGHRVHQPVVQKGYAKLEHVKIVDSDVEVLGEHIVADTINLGVKPFFCGSEIAITDLDENGKVLDDWVATLVYEGSSYEALERVGRDCLSKITHKINMVRNI